MAPPSCVSIKAQTRLELVSMSLLDYFISAAGLLLVAAVLWRGSRRGILTCYPYFYIYVGFVFLLNVFLLLGVQFGLPGYALVFWWGAAVAALLRFFVVWEVFRQAFPPGQPSRQIAAQVAILLIAALAAAMIMGGHKLSYLYKEESFFPDLERKVGLIQAFLLLSCLLLVRYYAVPLGRSLWGMALGLGVYLSVLVMNFSALELVDSFLPFWAFIRRFSFIGMVSLWAWAMWSHIPNSRRTVAPEEVRLGLERWRQAWGQARTALKRAVGL